MKLDFTDKFRRDYKSLSKIVQRQADKKLELLASNLLHPSLRVKKVKDKKDIYEGRVNIHYRFLFQITTDSYILLRIGKHDILEKL